MSTQTLTQKEQLAPVVARELAVLEIGATAYSIGKVTRIFLDAPAAEFDDVYGNLIKQTDATAAIVISGLIAARSGVPISYLVPAQMQEDLGNEYRNIEVVSDTATMMGKLIILKSSEADKRITAQRAAIADGSLAQAKTEQYIKSATRLKEKGVKLTEAQKAAIIAAL